MKFTSEIPLDEINVEHNSRKANCYIVNQLHTTERNVNIGA
jgi:hypothetical protein